MSATPREKAVVDAAIAFCGRLQNWYEATLKHSGDGGVKVERQLFDAVDALCQYDSQAYKLRERERA